MPGSGFPAASQVNPDELERLGGELSSSRREDLPPEPFNLGTLRPSMTTHDGEGEATNVAAESVQSVDADDFRGSRERGLAPVRGRWRLTLKGGALVGVVAAIGLVWAVRGVHDSGLFVDNDPAHARFPGDKTGTAPSNVDAMLGKEGAESAQSKVDVSTQASVAPFPASGSGDGRRIQQTVRASPSQQSIDPTPTSSTGWAVQLASSKSADEANNDLKRFNERYASLLNGSTIRLHKARVDGETVYRLRAVGLSKADATALCERLKGNGDSCLVVR